MQCKNLTSKPLIPKPGCDDLPDGEIMDNKELPGKIVSDGLVDNKNVNLN